MPGRLHRERLTRFASILADLQSVHPFSVTSWWRSPRRNRAKGGLSNSLHLEGLAADCIPDAAQPWASFVKAARAAGLDAVDEGDHVHVELDYRHD